VGCVRSGMDRCCDLGFRRLLVARIMMMWSWSIGSSVRSRWGTIVIWGLFHG